MNCVSATLMNDFYVLGSNLSFPSSLPGPMGGSGYHLCGQYQGTPPVGQISRITCQPQPITAQYVYLQLDRSANPQEMEMCEVWVYGSKLTICYQMITITSSIILSFTRLIKGTLTVDVKITIWAQHNTYLGLSMGFLANVPTDESPPTQSDGDIALASVRPSVWFEVSGHWKGIIELTSNLAFCAFGENSVQEWFNFRPWWV